MTISNTVATRSEEMQALVSTFPEELIMTPQWVLWKLEMRGDKSTKIPYQVDGTKAESTNPETWLDFQNVAMAYVTDGSYSGVGFVFSEADPYVGIDLDKCRNPETGEVEPWATEILADIPTYAELSPSGKGFHLLGKGCLPPTGRRKGQIEMYESGRYFTVTGGHVPDSPHEVQDIGDKLTALHRRVFGSIEVSSTKVKPAGSPISVIPARPAGAPLLDDGTVMASIMASSDANDFQVFQLGDWPSLGYPSQSEADLAFTGMLVRHTKGCAEQVDRMFRSTGMMREKWDELRGEHTYGEMTIIKALSGGTTMDKLDKFMEMMNSRYALVRHGNQVRILEQSAPDGHFNLYTKADFDLLTANLAFPGEGKSAANTWLKSPKRREFSSIVFKPGKETPFEYNLWRGFSVKGKTGDWSLFRRLMLEAICAGSIVLFNYLFKYFAHMVQRPWERPEVALVMRGGQGVGKNTVVDTMGALIAMHFVEVSCVDQLTGRFNGHMRNAVLVHANEATWGGNKSESGKLKAMITDATIPIEMKGIDISHIDNYMRLVVSSNNEWPVPVEADDRRFLMFDVAPVFKQDTAFFGALHAQMAAGGLEALMHDLTNEDLSNFSPRNKPVSPHGADMKLRSAETPTRWLHECLNHNVLPLGAGNSTSADALFADPDGAATIAKADLFDSYEKWCRTTPERFSVGRDRFFLSLRKLLGATLTESRPTSTAMNSPNAPRIRERKFTFTSLAACRTAFEAATGTVGMVTWEPS